MGRWQMVRRGRFILCITAISIWFSIPYGSTRCDAMTVKLFDQVGVYYRGHNHGDTTHTVGSEAHGSLRRIIDHWQRIRPARFRFGASKEVHLDDRDSQGSPKESIVGPR
jgi:hypothetical protein